MAELCFLPSAWERFGRVLGSSSQWNYPSVVCFLRFFVDVRVIGETWWNRIVLTRLSETDFFRIKPLATAEETINLKIQSRLQALDWNLLRLGLIHILQDSYWLEQCKWFQASEKMRKVDWDGLSKSWCMFWLEMSCWLMLVRPMPVSSVSCFYGFFSHGRMDREHLMGSCKPWSSPWGPRADSDNINC